MAPDAIWNRSAPAVASAMLALVAAHCARGARVNPDRIINARAALAAEIEGTRAVANLLGREWLMHEAWRQAGARDRTHFAAPAGVPRYPLVPSQPTYHEAVAAILRRTPTLAKGAEAVQAAARAGGIAFAKAADLNVTKRVQAALARAIRDGASREEVVAEISKDARWPRAYAETVYRTNAVSAYADGVVEQARGSDGLVEGFEFSSVGDGDTRPNHKRAHGYVARVESPVWDTLRPALGHNCRCALIPVSRLEARRRFGRDGIPLFMPVPRGAGPDEGFSK